MANPVTITPALGVDMVGGQGSNLSAVDVRRAWSGFERGEGVATYGSFRVSQRAAGANLSVDANMDDGAWVRGDSVALQGLYYVPPASAAANVDIAAAHATNPRIDIVVLEVKDDTHDVSGLTLARVRVVSGTATGGATLDNRTGAATTPDSSILLADVEVPALDTTIADAQIRDRRPFCSPGTVPPVLTDVDIVAFEPSPAITRLGTVFNVTSSEDLRQSAALMYLPRRIVSATKIRWEYHQSGTALTGTYVFSINDASGRKIIDTGSVAFTGGNLSSQSRAETITATTFEAGWYYVLFGVDTTNAGVLSFNGVAPAEPVTCPNAVLVSATGGATAPATVLGMTDKCGLFPATSYVDLPIVALSVG